MEKKKNTPKLRFPEFTGEWEEKKLGEIANISSGGTPNRSNSRYWDGNIAWITTSLINFNVIYKAEEYITDEGLQNSSAKLFPSGTLLMAMYGQGVTRGKVSILGIEASCNQACCAIVPKKNLYDKLFIFQNLFYRYDEIRNLSNQGGQQNLSGEIIKNIPIKLAAYSEQTKIATFLTAVDEKLTQLKKKKTLLEQYKKGVMQKLFSQELRFKDDNNQDFPDWQEKMLGEMISLVVDNRGKTPSTIDEGIPLLEINSIGRKEINYNVVTKYVSEITYVSWFRKYLESGDVLFSTVGNTALCSYYTGEIKACVAQNIVGLRFKNEVSLFMYYLMIEEKNKIKFKQIEMGAVQPSIKVSQMIDLYFEVPNLSEQQKIATFLSAIDEKISHCSAQIEKTEAWKKGLLQQMFC